MLRICVRGKALELLRAREMADSLAFLPTFMVDMDIILHGGLLTGSITEVSCFLSGVLMYCCQVLYYVVCVLLSTVQCWMRSYWCAIEPAFDS